MVMTPDEDNTQNMPIPADGDGDPCDVVYPESAEPPEDDGNDYNPMAAVLESNEEAPEE